MTCFGLAGVTTSTVGENCTEGASSVFIHLTSPLPQQQCVDYGFVAHQCTAGKANLNVDLQKAYKILKDGGKKSWGSVSLCHCLHMITPEHLLSSMGQY